METLHHQQEAERSAQLLQPRLSGAISAQEVAGEIYKHVQETRGQAEQQTPEVVQAEALQLLSAIELPAHVKESEVRGEIEERVKTQKEIARLKAETVFQHSQPPASEGPESGQPALPAAGTFGETVDPGGTSAPMPQAAAQPAPQAAETGGAVAA